MIRTVTLPHLQLFGVSDNLELRVTALSFLLRAVVIDAQDPRQIKKRGAPPLGGGEIEFCCPIVKQLKTLNFVEPGKIKRIRGIACALIVLALNMIFIRTAI